MKHIVGYLIDRTTGAGISGKTVAFNKLSGAAISSTDTYYLDASSATDADGRFYAKMELSPGPINVLVTVSGSEVKVRKWDEQAQLKYNFSSDINRLARAREGVIRSYLNEMAVTIPSGHTIRIATGGAIFNGNVFSIENGVYDKLGTANNNAALNPRLDLITLRQYNEDAAGQLAGSQTVIITEGTVQNVAPATPTGADFKDFPLAVVSTVHLGSTKTLHTDSRVFTDAVAAHSHTNPGITVKLNNASPSTTITTLDFPSEFTKSESPTGEINLALQRGVANATQVPAGDHTHALPGHTHVHTHSLIFGDVSDGTSCPAEGICTTTATCSAGLRVTGGGFVCDASQEVRRNYPASSTSWQVQWLNHSDNTRACTAYAMCIDDITQSN